MQQNKPVHQCQTGEVSKRPRGTVGCFGMAKSIIWPFQNGQAISKPCKGIKTAMAISKWPKVLKRQVTVNTR